MPTYQYACTNTTCGNEFELVQSFTDPTASECPVCHGPVRKVFSAVGVVFKGSGFYRTDSRAGSKLSSDSAGSSSSSKSDSSSGSGSGSGSSSKSDSGSKSDSAPSTSSKSASDSSKSSAASSSSGSSSSSAASA